MTIIAGDPVDRAEIIVRHVGGSAVDPVTKMVDGSAFDRTPKDTDGLSVNRMGILASDPDRDRAEIRRVVGARRKLGSTSIFVEINVGAMLDALAEFEVDVAVVADPLPAENEWPPNPAHALILGLPFAGEAVGSLKSELAGDRIRQQIIGRFPAVVPIE